MSDLSSDHRWAVRLKSNVDYTDVVLFERIGEAMNPWQPRSETNRDRWERRDQGHCYLRPPQGRETSRTLDCVDQTLGFVEERDARDWFAFMTRGPSAFRDAPAPTDD